MSKQKARAWGIPIYEFLGTALITYAYCLADVSAQDISASNSDGYQKQAKVRGLSYFVGYVIAYEVSGAHFNPALTIADIIVQIS